jgi:hypothetical protein
MDTLLLELLERADANDPRAAILTRQDVSAWPQGVLQQLLQNSKTSL